MSGSRVYTDYLVLCVLGRRYVDSAGRAWRPQAGEQINLAQRETLAARAMTATRELAEHVRDGRFDVSNFAGTSNE
jgi:hypothetical protein